MRRHHKLLVLFPLMCISLRNHTAITVPNQVKQEGHVTWQHISEPSLPLPAPAAAATTTESQENVSLSLHRNVTLLPWYDACDTHQETIFVLCAPNNCISPSLYQQQQQPAPPQQQHWSISICFMTVVGLSRPCIKAEMSKTNVEGRLW